VARLDAEQAETVCRGYVQSMPGAVQVRLNAGDFMLYRNTLWHTGNDVPYIKRATIHGALLTPEGRDFCLNDFIPVLDPAKGPRHWENPNAGAGGTAFTDHDVTHLRLQPGVRRSSRDFHRPRHDEPLGDPRHRRGHLRR
jgi:hypothetical protein